jgi:hypothetical protein
MLESMLNLDGKEMYVKGETLYMPLLYSSETSEIEQEMAGKGQRIKQPAVQHNGQIYVAVVSLRSLIENYSLQNPDSYESMRLALLKRYEIENMSGSISLQDKLMERLVFEVMPHFAKLSDEPGRRSAPTRAEILNKLAEKANIPLDEYRSKVKIASDSTPLEKAIDQLKAFRQGIAFPDEGAITPDALEIWYKEALEKHILGKEAELRENIMAIRDEYLQKELDRQAVMLYLAENGGFEIDRFGVMKDGSSNYKVYVHTGEYALKDLEGRIYLFPDGKVGFNVTPSSLGHPMVIDKYKHPFLTGRSFAPMQPICIHDLRSRDNSTSQNISNRLEAALSVIYYGYGLRGSISDTALEPGNNRGDFFGNYRIRNDDPRIASGEIEITNLR